MSSRRATAPRRYTCSSADRGLLVSTCMSNRTTRGIAPGTAISLAQSSGTSWNPILRAASAGNSAVRSGVAVKTTLITSSGTRLLRVITSVTSSVVPSRMSARSLASTWTAPRIALTATTCPFALTSCDVAACSKAIGGERETWPCASAARAERLVSEADSRVQLPHFGGGERPGGPWPQVAEGHRPHLRADQPGHRVPGRGQQPAHDVLAPLMQGDLHQGTGTRPLHHPELVGAGHPVVQFDPGEQPPSQVPLHRAGHIRQVGLEHAVPG